MPAPMPREVLDPTAARLERELKHAKPLVGCRFDPSGRFLGKPVSTGIRPRFTDKFADHGITLSPRVFATPPTRPGAR